MTIIATDQLRDIASSEFADIVEQVLLPDVNEMRIFLTDGSSVDVARFLRRHFASSSPLCGAN